MLPIDRPGSPKEFGLGEDQRELGVLVPDYLVTLYVAICTRQLRYVLMAPAFTFLRITDAYVCLRALRLPKRVCAFLRRCRGPAKCSMPLRTFRNTSTR